MTRTQIAAVVTTFALAVSSFVAPAAWAAELTTGRHQGSRAGQAGGAGVRQFGGHPGVPHQDHGRHQRHVPQQRQHGSFNPHRFGPSYPFGHDYKGPSYPFGNHYYRAAPAGPVHVAPPHRVPRWVPGHWGQQWVPQYHSYEVFVPGYFTASGRWVQGFYETRTADGSHYQEVWVDGHWSE